MPRDTLSLIPISDVSSKKAAANKPARKRDWERKRRSTSFYIPPHLHERVIKPDGVRNLLRTIANREVVTVDEVAREFIDYGLHSYQAGQIPIDTIPKAQTQKLQINFKSRDVRWQTNVNPVPVDLVVTAKNKPVTKTRKLILSYRWADNELYQRVVEIADKHGVYLGDIAVLLLEHSIKEYMENRLLLSSKTTIEKMVVGWAKRVNHAKS